MPRIDPFDFDDEEPLRARVGPKRSAAKPAAAAPTLAEAERAAQKTPEAFLSWMARVGARHGDALPDLLESLSASLGESSARLFRRVASLAIDADDAWALRLMMISGAQQTREDGTMDLLAKAFSTGARSCVDAFLSLGCDTQGPWFARNAANWAFARSDSDLAELASLAGAAPRLHAQFLKLEAEGLPLAYLRAADSFDPLMAAWCAERATEPTSLSLAAEALGVRQIADETLKGVDLALDAFRKAGAWSAKDEAETPVCAFASLHDPALCVWSWKVWGVGARSPLGGLFSMLASNLFPQHSEQTRLACAQALLDAGASPLDETGEGPSAIDLWPALAQLFAREERASLREALAEPPAPRKAAEPPQPAAKTGRRL